MLEAASSKHELSNGTTIDKTRKATQHNSRFIEVKKNAYDLDKKPPITSTLLPKPKVIPEGIKSVADMIEEHVKVKEAVRFKKKQSKKTLNEDKKKDILKETIQEKIAKIAKLRVSIDKAVGVTSKIKQVNLRPKKKKINYASYSVMPGDVLSKVAHKFSLSSSELASINGMKKNAKLSIRQKLKIPLSQVMVDSIVDSAYTIQSGDTIRSIAHKFKLKVSDLIRVNHLKRSGYIRKGKKLILPFPALLRELKRKEMKRQELKRQELKRKELKRKELKRKELKRQALKRKELKRKELKRQALKRKALKRKELKRKALKRKEMKLKQFLEAKRKKRLKRFKLLKRFKERKRLKRLNRLKDKRVVAAKRSHIKKVKGFGKHSLRVTATAYSSHRGQTDSTPFLAAWSNHIRPGMKIIAVSRDLLYKYGLRNGSRVRIGGLRGYYRVRDKMNKRYKRRIDIYMGMNRRRALRWGRRSVVLYW